MCWVLTSTSPLYNGINIHMRQMLTLIRGKDMQKCVNHIRERNPFWLCCLQTCNKPGVVGGGKWCVYNRLCTVCLRVNGWCDIVLLISHVCDGWQDYSVSLILVSCSLSDTSHHQHHILFSHIALGPLSSYKLKLCTLSHVYVVAQCYHFRQQSCSVYSLKPRRQKAFLKNHEFPWESMNVFRTVVFDLC